MAPTGSAQVDMIPLATCKQPVSAPSIATGRFWPFPLCVAILALSQWTTGYADGAGPAAIAALLIMTIGIPHGALDVEIAAVRFNRASQAGRRFIITAYLAGAAVMALLWWLLPSLALIVFLAVSILHFGQDWAEAGEPFLVTMAGWAIIALPALTHTADVAAIFTLLVGSADGASVAYILACSAAPAVLCSLVVLHNAVRAWQMRLAVPLATALTAAVFLPPLVAFALYFCLFHTPQHMAGAWRESAHLSAGRRLWVISAVSGLAFGLAALLFSVSGSAAISDNVVATSFIILSVLTLPHFLLEALNHQSSAAHRHGA
jgi:Brp/Blh family beta-carotene 15,15'-monooxygenase